jgi:hypothetical protein
VTLRSAITGNVERPSVAWFFAALSFGCGALLSPTTERPEREARERLRLGGQRTHVILVALDGVRPHEVFHGSDPKRSDVRMSAEALLPNLAVIGARGVRLGEPGSDATFEASGPNFISLPGYQELFSGTPSTCRRNDCVERPSYTLVDRYLDAGAGPEDVAVISSWETIERALTERAAQGAFVSVGRHGGSAHRETELEEGLRTLLEEGRDADASPGHGDYRPDARTIEVAIETLRRREPAFSFVGLGDTDEHAHADNYAGYLAALGAADDMLGEILVLADEWTARGEPTTIVVTTDHGRSAGFTSHGSDHPESRAIWLVAAGPGVRALRGGRLADVAPALASIAGLVPKDPLDVAPMLAVTN